MILQFSQNTISVRGMTWSIVMRSQRGWTAVQVWTGTMVSKAAYRSRVTRTVAHQSSAALKMSLVIFSSADSIEWDQRYTDWGWQSDGKMCCWSWTRYSRSRILLMMLRFEIGLLLDGFFGSSPGFFTIGNTWAVLNRWKHTIPKGQVGNVHDDRWEHIAAVA